MNLLHGLAAIAAALSLKSLGASWETEEQSAAIDAAMAKFPAEFGLKAFPGKRFSIHREASLWDSGLYHGKPDHEPGPLFYVFIYAEDTGRWEAFAKATPAELRRNIVR
jgi:hypothetical protein